MIRVGLGYDSHRLVEGRALILGGVRIPHAKGLLGHSDADALAHALTDALLGAAALGNIGQHFPDSDPRFKGADSMGLLSEVVRMVEKEGFVIINVDANIIAQEPKLNPHIEQIRSRLADCLGVEAGRVSVKAKTDEGLGPVGRGEAICAQAVVLLESRS